MLLRRNRRSQQDTAAGGSYQKRSSVVKTARISKTVNSYQCSVTFNLRK
jgi:hypothetical protein